MAATITPTDFQAIKEKKIELIKQLLAIEPPKSQGDQIVALWEQLYDAQAQSVVVETTTGPSSDENYAFPYEKLRAIVGDGGNWKWPRMWQRFDEMERRGPQYREGEIINFQGFNKNPNILPQKVLVVGGGPIGMRMAIELKMGGHDVTLCEKRREIRDESGELSALGFTNRINRPHMWQYVRNDLEKLNGKDLMSRQAAYPVFTEPETSSIGIDELQCLLLKNVLMLGVDFRLGVGYEDAKIAIDPKTCKPRWQCEMTYDAHAAKMFGKTEGKVTDLYDVLVGVDGSRSRVRETQTKYFGNIEKRKFMDCVGIVGNVQKLTRSRLKELNYPHGQEPSDMNRTKMVFGEFFQRLNDEADADLENVIYYKASYSNYIILTPKRANLIKHGLSGKVYHFAAGRSGAGNNMATEKQKLKDYVKKVLQIAGIPLDPNLSNEGFVEAPNDVMAFDFAECWNTPKSIAFNLAPPDYNVDEHGPWVGEPLIPPIMLAGDALLEPFWPLGLGLKRGWQAIMDANYCIDNLYNRTLYCEELGKSPDTFSWDDHWEALSERCKENFSSCSKVEVAEDIGRGEYAADGLVMNQWKKYAGEKDRPVYLCEIDPNTRYKKRNLTLNSAQKRLALEDKDWRHPVVTRNIAIHEYVDKVKKEGEKANGWKKLLTIDGKTVTAPKSGYTFKAPSAPAAAAPKPFALPKAEVEKKAEEKRSSLMRTVTSEQIEAHITSGSEKRKSLMAQQSAGLLAALKQKQGHSSSTEADLHDVAYTAPDHEGLADQSHAMWDRMLEKGLTPAQEAELGHIRNMINALSASIDHYKKAEKAILMGNK